MKFTVTQFKMIYSKHSGLEKSTVSHQKSILLKYENTDSYTAK